MKVLEFYKEGGIWYADIPEFLERGLGTKANLMMVCGADTLLDKLSKNGQNAAILISEVDFEGATDKLVRTGYGLDSVELERLGHAPVSYGAYYHAVALKHDLWLCPVTEFVFGNYPTQIFIKIL